ncbi:MAG: HAD family hydrolase [Candidatus Thermoplasmatota archaeon]|nr:HAD family hydrolase [Candidatus Thermoplasmatota archaeon]
MPRADLKAVLFDIGNTIAPFTRLEYERFIASWYSLSDLHRTDITYDMFRSSFEDVFSTEMKRSRDGSWETSPSIRSLLLLEELGNRGFDAYGSLDRLVVSHTQAFTGCLSLDPDARNVVEELRDMEGPDGIKLRVGIISNAPDGRSIRDFLSREGAIDLFHPLVISAEVGISKPSEAIFRKALDEIAVEPKDAIYVGDRYRTDILPARKLGMKAIYIRQYITDGEPPEGEGIQGPVIQHITGLLDLIPLSS